ncbi:unnamed protein product [Acanthocheilonema viteae]|uniref:C-type lectin domain-containing protein n=1 Tax=Acanthocheilonema viteae TaxID=6277 RepID=A0A498SD51_ACAVI|nr:unnamed protein product [Acanthocheilonema viteae]
MSKQWFVRLTVASVAFFTQTAGSDSMVKARQMSILPFFQNYGTPWIAGPEGHHYQFHLSKQSWNMARESCLALASDLVIISSLQQMNWLISHYPLSNSIMPERTVQIGLALVNKENSTKKEWKWVNNTPLNTTYLEWEMVAINRTEKNLHSTERGRCALLSIDNRILKAIPCDQTPDFDYTNRYICERSHEQHREHEKKNNPFYESFVQLINKLQKGAAVKPEPRTVQLQKVKTEVMDVQGKTEDLSFISRMKENFTNENKKDRLTMIQKIPVKETLTTTDPNVKGIDEIEQKAQEKQKGEEKDKTANGNEPRPKNFAAKLKSIVRKENTKNIEDVLLANRIESGFKHNVTISTNSTNPPKQKSQQSDEFCNENDIAQKDTRQWYEQFGDIFRNLNLFLKQEKSSDLRALLDNNDTNKTLVERLKEALHTKNKTVMSKPDMTEIKKTSHNGIDNQPQFDDSIQKKDNVSNTPTHETDNINSIFLHKKSTARPTVTGRIYDMTRPGKTKIYGKDESEQRSKTNGDGIYELLGQKLKIMLTEHLRNLSNLTTNKSSEEIKSDISEGQINRNEASVYYDIGNDQKLESSSLLFTNRNNATEEATSVHTFITNSQQTTKRSTKSHNETGTLLELSNDIILLEEHKVGGNKTNIKIDIQKAISNMKQNVESASEEIKRLFSHARRWL